MRVNLAAQVRILCGPRHMQQCFYTSLLVTTGDECVACALHGRLYTADPGFYPDGGQIFDYLQCKESKGGSAEEKGQYHSLQNPK